MLLLLLLLRTVAWGVMEETGTMVYGECKEVWAAVVVD
jgi:hypothetical protein